MTDEFWKAHGDWSQAAFGRDSERGPAGPLKHLLLEVAVELLGIPRPDVEALLAKAQEPSKDPEEYADLYLLVQDAARRAGMTRDSFMTECWRKLKINKARKWPKPTSDSPVEHVKD